MFWRQGDITEADHLSHIAAMFQPPERRHHPETFEWVLIQRCQLSIKRKKFSLPPSLSFPTQIIQCVSLILAVFSDKSFKL